MPVNRLHRSQWQLITSRSSPRIVNRTPPHRHRPWANGIQTWARRPPARSIVEPIVPPARDRKRRLAAE